MSILFITIILSQLFIDLRYAFFIMYIVSYAPSLFIFLNNK